MMKNLLHVISSPKKHQSHSIRLGRAIINKLAERYPGSCITERDLLAHTPPFLSYQQIASFSQKDTAEKEQEALRYSDSVLREIVQADIIVLGAPMYNFSIHASLKAYIDQIVRMGQSVAYRPDGTRVGLIADKTVYLAITAGGSYKNSGFDPVTDHITNYLTTILNYIGITSITPVVIEGTAKPGFEVNYDEVCSPV